MTYVCFRPVQCPSGGIAFDVSEKAPPGTRLGAVNAVGSGVSYQIVTSALDGLLTVDKER